MGTGKRASRPLAGMGIAPIMCHDGRLEDGMPLYGNPTSGLESYFPRSCSSSKKVFEEDPATAC